MSKYFSNTQLLKKPTQRAAFSDRSAYVMAEMSKLAYFKFEGGQNVAGIIEDVSKLMDKGEALDKVIALVKSFNVPEDEVAGKKLLAEILEPYDFELIEGFHNSADEPGIKKGAQAFLCRHMKEKYAVLAFRGTEPNLNDIKADVKANLDTIEIRGKDVQIHSGFLSQYRSIEKEIKENLAKEELDGYQLFITGHSLGGALAIIATKCLANDTAGACYTFGSPPVGTKDFDRDIKTPIYRIINHVDIVPRLPNPTMVFVVRGIFMLIEMILDTVGVVLTTMKKWDWYKKLQMFLADAQKYRQSGYGSYLVGDGVNVKLRYSVGTFDRFCWWMKQFRNFFIKDFKLLSDHSIDTYSQKLANWATHRQGDKVDVKNSDEITKKDAKEK